MDHGARLSSLEARADSLERVMARQAGIVASLVLVLLGGVLAAFLAGCFQPAQ